MAKLDLTTAYKAYYKAATKPEIVEIASAQYIAIEGKGDPSSATFASDIQALYTLAYVIKFECKSMDKDFVVAKLEGQWWFDAEHYDNPSMSEAPVKIPRSEWMYRLLIRMPEFVSEDIFNQCKSKALATKHVVRIGDISFFQMTEGKCVQMLHVGPFDTESVTLSKMMTLIDQYGFQQNGLHHEIYLSDFRKVSPDKLKTILREPVK